MRTTIDIPDGLMKQAKKKAIEEGISLKEFFTRSLEKELSVGTSGLSPAPWKKLRGKGQTSGLKAEESGFEGYTGPDWNYGVQVNEPE